MCAPALAFVAPYVLVAIACSSASSSDGGGAVTPGENTEAGAGDGEARFDALAPPPPAKGDPCRGVPLPADQHYVPAGLCASLVATNLKAFRQITFAPNGDLFGVDASGAIKRLRDEDGDGFFQAGEITAYASTGGNGNNAHIDVAGGFMYAGTPNGVKRFSYSPTSTTGGAGDVVISDQPTGGHSKHTVHVYDGFLYVHSGSSDNFSSPNGAAYDDDRSLIRRFDLSKYAPGTPMPWLSGEIVTHGLRNANGFTKNAAGRMYAVVNGMDNIGYAGTDVHGDNPGEQVVEIAPGKKYGFPFCFTAQRVVVGGNVVAAGTQLARVGSAHDDAWCAAESSQPATFVQAHTAPLDITFFDSHPQGALPERYRGGAFVAMHGSWNRSPATGYKVVWIPFDASGKAPMPTSTATSTTFPYETVFGGGDTGGAKDGPWTWTGEGGYADAPRFAGVAVSPVDGALYATSDESGYLYRIGVRPPK